MAVDTSRLRVAVDAMGGDRAPSEILAAAHEAAALGIPVVMVGPADLEGRGDLDLIVASEVIEMHDDAAQGVRRKKDSTLVRAAEAVPSDARAERGWRALRIAGTIDFALTGVLASVLAPLGDGAISIFAISTYDTDYILVREHALADAIETLRAVGHDVHTP